MASLCVMCMEHSEADSYVVWYGGKFEWRRKEQIVRKKSRLLNI